MKFTMNMKKHEIHNAKLMSCRLHNGMYPFDTFQSVPFAVIHNSIEVARSSDFCDELPAFANIR